VRASGLRILVLGAGSIGARHASNLKLLGADVAIWDPDLERARRLASTGLRVAHSSRASSVDGVVVASPTTAHAEQLGAALEDGAHVFVEKPLAVRAADVAAVVDGAGDRIMVGYNLRLHGPLEALAARYHAGEAGRLLGARLWFGQYLPDWRPEVDYRGTYSARRRLGGGVLLDASHELDLAVWLFGQRLSIEHAQVKKLGDLDIDVEDTVRAVLSAPNGAPVEIALDYLSRTYRRGIEIIASDATLRYDWAREVLEVERGGRRHTESFGVPIARSYEREAERFVDFIREATPPPVDGRAGLASLRLADDIRAAST
jgi:predicted dehydrogenase